jgi:hypothetical protein
VQQLSRCLEGDIMIQNVAQMYEVTRSAVNPLKHGMNSLLTIFNDMEFDKPLYCFTLPGFILMAGGLHMSLNLVLAAYPGGSFDLGSAIWVFLLTLIGIFMSFTGILLHSISRLIRYKKINCESLRTR